MVGFSCHIGIASNNKVELWAIRQGLITARDMGIKFLNVHVDSTFVLTCLTSSRNWAPELFPIIFYCRMLLNRECSMVHLHHIYYEANSVVDGLAKRGRMQA